LRDIYEHGSSVLSFFERVQLLRVFHETQIDVTGLFPGFLGMCLSKSARIFQKSLGKHERRLVGLYDVGIVWSFPGFAIIITIDFFHLTGK